MWKEDEQQLERDLLEQVTDWWRKVEKMAGERLVCRPGCTDCCFGPFSISLPDARRLREGLARLFEEDPAKARSVQARAREAGEWFGRAFPGDLETGILNRENLDRERFFERFSRLPCPALNPEEGTCDLYGSRPLSCRTFGPPVRIGGQDLPHCKLCFQGVAGREVEECRTSPPGEPIEQVLRERMSGTEEPGGETLVAFALLAGTLDR